MYSRKRTGYDEEEDDSQGGQSHREKGETKTIDTKIDEMRQALTTNFDTQIRDIDSYYNRVMQTLEQQRDQQKNHVKEHYNKMRQDLNIVQEQARNISQLNPAQVQIQNKLLESNINTLSQNKGNMDLELNNPTVDPYIPAKNEEAKEEDDTSMIEPIVPVTFSEIDDTKNWVSVNRLVEISNYCEFKAGRYGDKITYTDQTAHELTSEQLCYCICCCLCQPCKRCGNSSAKNIEKVGFQVTQQAESVILQALKQAINIKILELDLSYYVSNKINLSNMPHLVDLSITAGSSLDNIIEILKPCQQLKRIAFRYTQEARETSSYYSLLSVIGTMTQLTILDLNFYDKLPPDSFEGLNNLVNLQKLQIQGKTVDIDPTFEYLKKLRSLVSVYVKSEYQDSNHTQKFKTLTEGDFKLKQLILELRLTHIDSHSLEDNLAKIQSLRELEVRFPWKKDHYYGSYGSQVNGQLDLGKLQKLRSLTLVGDGDDIKSYQDLFLKSLQLCYGLRSLALHLAQEADIVEKIALLQNLKNIDLKFHDSKTEINSIQCQTLFAGLKNMNKLEKLFFESKNTSCLDDSLVNQLALALEGKQQFKNLYFRLKEATDVTDKSFMKLIKVLFVQKQNLEYFGFVCDTFKGISGQSVELLVESLKNCKDLSTIEFNVCGNNNITDSTIDTILPTLKQIRSEAGMFIKFTFENLARVQKTKLDELSPFKGDNYSNLLISKVLGIKVAKQRY